MFGLTFLEPLYLAGLATLPLPILIHLLQRRRAKVVAWSSLEFLRPLEKPRTRRLDLRRLLLLALRVLILTFLSLALARPSLPGGAPGVDAPTAAVIILAVLGIISGFVMKKKKGDSIRLFHFTVNVLGYLLLLGTIFTGLVIGGIIVR